MSFLDPVSYLCPLVSHDGVSTLTPHYIVSGAKISSVTYFSSYERLKLGHQNLVDCSSMQSFATFKTKNELEKDETTKKSLNLTQCWSDGNGSHLKGKSRTKLVTFGTKPDEKLSKWADQDIKPIPIKMELTPIVNLFNPSTLDERYNISSDAILQWFLPLYLKYCKVCL